MTASFSPSTGGVYPAAVYTHPPSDALLIPDALYQQFRNGEISGFDVADGKVVAKSTAATAEALWREHQRQAQVALDKSDITVLRCAENGIPVPVDWRSYRSELRAVISAPSGDASLPPPIQPAYPVGTD
ncbi:MAG TPA: hypothetical protein VL051_09530 [Burkholderiaceae bacterium]|nr:hypothetical protein [Burkholderiaceae bacterium]